MSRIRITQKKSTIDRSLKQKRTMKALGLGKINRSVVHNDNAEIRGMVRVVAHLVEVQDNQ